MSVPARQFGARVVARTPLSEHLVRLTLGGPGLAGFTSTGIPDEWVGLVVPGQFQSRYYTLRRVEAESLTVDVVLHEHGLVTEWAARDCVGEEVVITEPKGAFAPPPDTSWVLLVGDLTALPAMARIAESVRDVSGRVWVEAPEVVPDYLPDDACVTWLPAAVPGASRLAEVVADLDWPEGPGYFWMAGESAQMRAVRHHLMRERGLPATAYHAMGYWRAASVRQAHATGGLA